MGYSRHSTLKDERAPVYRVRARMDTTDILSDGGPHT